MTIPFAARILLFLAALCALGGTACIAEESAAELRQAYGELLASHGQGIHRPSVPKSGEMLFLGSDQYTDSAEAVGSPTPSHQAYAEELFALATRAAEAGQPSLALQWATEVVAFDPNHAEARRVLGYERVGDDWRTPYALRMAEKDRHWHSQFGWIVDSDVVRYEAGERKVGSKWISAKDDARRHQRIEDGWQIRSDHFLVTTNHSLEAGVDLAGRLERLHQAWRQLFAGFYLSDREIRQLFAGQRKARGRSKPFRVIYHRDKGEYVAALRRRQPRIAETLGIYFDQQREAHFFAAGDSLVLAELPLPADISVLYHEAVHQLFQESRRSARHVGQIANFWVIEGVATYFESLAEHRDSQFGSYFTVGQADAGRLPAARQRALVDDFYLPLAEFTQLGKSDLQRHPEIAKLYSQAAGLATCLIHAEEGQYREPLVRYLEAIYAGRDTPKSLAEATGRSFAEIDSIYRKFLQSLP